MSYKIKLVSFISILFIAIGLGVILTTETNAQGKANQEGSGKYNSALAKYIQSKGKRYEIGDRGPAGGTIFYDRGNYSGGWRYLEAAPHIFKPVKWGCYEKYIPGARGTAIGSGKKNTQAIVKACGEERIAAKLCVEYKQGGYNDWFLPSKEELGLMISSSFLKKGMNRNAGVYYWSSSEVEDRKGFAWYLGLYLGTLNNATKDVKQNVRPVRAF